MEFFDPSVLFVLSTAATWKDREAGASSVCDSSPLCRDLSVGTLISLGFSVHSHLRLLLYETAMFEKTGCPFFFLFLFVFLFPAFSEWRFFFQPLLHGGGLDTSLGSLTASE